MKVLSVASEMFPLIKTGGLADVTGALPKALWGFGIGTITLIPGYREVMAKLSPDAPPLLVFGDILGAPAALRHLQLDDLTLFVLDIPELYDRPGSPYLNEWGVDHADNWRRFAALSMAAARIAEGALPAWQPDIVHTHDWQSAMTSVYMRQRNVVVPTVLTIHNLAFQGQFDAGLLPWIGLPQSTYDIDCLEYYQSISYLKGGLMTADVITTVSPTYSREILTPRFGMGMEGILRHRRGRLRGILNGIDAEIWNPATDPYLPYTYDEETIALKRNNRPALLSAFGLEDNGGPIFAAVSRLTWQKGMDMLAEAAHEVADCGGMLLVCGQGDPAIEHLLLDTAAHFPGRMAVHIGYDEKMAHLVHGGADAIIQPSRFEPCGLTQLYGLRYGSIPVVSRTGGLSETVIDANDAAMSAGVATGFQFHPVNTEGLRHAIHRARDVFGQPEIWRRLQIQAMKAHFSWERSASLYASLYRGLRNHRMGREGLLGRQAR